MQFVYNYLNFFIHVYVIHKYQYIPKLQTVVLAIVVCFQHSKCDFQRLSRTTFLHLSVPLSSERQLNCWVTWFVLQIGCCILAWDLCEFHTKQ
jgi:hypothetical protein